ncbi:ANTAR domain-containing protein [Mycobacterium avium]|uniref:ANTAR domain-containing protein n=1 Tax=Mycobacterium avium TaxID=1764 RepID=UPI0013C45C57|nr:ANTAR domain-containing protein [Mycobacterium avium]
MTSNWVPTQTSCGPHSGRILDTARGILIGLRRCPSEAALDELHSAALRHKVPVFAMAWALVHLAGAGQQTPSFVDAQSAARSRPVEWCKSGRVSACGSVVATMP